MNRRQLIQATWVPISKRLPPNTKVMLLCWNWKTNTVHEFQAFIARNHAIAELEGTGNELSWDRRISHWIHFPGPRGEEIRYTGDAAFDNSTMRKRGQKK